MSTHKYVTPEQREAYQQVRKKDRHKPGRSDTRKGDRHKPGRRDTRKGDRHVTQFDSYRFLAWDGEGVTREDTRHDYVLLMNSDGVVTLDPQGLSTIACFEALLAESHKPVFHVIFSGNYDVNKMLKDIPRLLLEKLHSGNMITWHANRDRNLVYSLEYHPKRCLILNRYNPSMQLFSVITDSRGRTHNKPNYNASLRLWDVFGFFGTSFLKTLVAHFSTEEIEAIGYQQIAQGKERRSDFSAQELEHFIIPYTRLEVQALAALMERLRDYMRRAGVRVNRWDGAGAIASVLLQHMRVKDHYGEPLPGRIYTALQHAYSAGRIEAVQYGHMEQTIHHYDLNSAYPAMMLGLPSLLDAYWEPVTSTLNEIAVLLVTWDFPEMPFYPFFVRGYDGTLIYSKQGSNWVSSYEFNAARNTIPHFERSVQVKQAYNLVTPHSDVKPYAKVAEYYQQRLVWKRDGIGAQIIFKLGPNSFYGKTVQSLGYSEKEGKIPSYFNLLYGSMITAKTRATLFRVAMQDPDTIIAFSTDGIWSTNPLDVAVGDGLGQWSYEKLDGLTLAQSGVYWAHKDGSTHEYYRGYTKGELQERNVLDAWVTGKNALYVPTTRFITLGTALASDERFKLWGQWETPEPGKKLELRATGKRMDYEHNRQNPAYGPVRTQASDRYGYSMSYPVAFPWDKDYQEVPPELQARRLDDLALFEETEEINEL